MINDLSVRYAGQFLSALGPYTFVVLLFTISAAVVLEIPKACVTWGWFGALFLDLDRK